MLTSILAHHDGWGYGPGPWLLIFPLLWVTLIGFLVWRFSRWRGPWRAQSTGRSVLAERYARGDISADEYRERRDVLREDDR